MMGPHGGVVAFYCHGVKHTTVLMHSISVKLPTTVCIAVVECHFTMTYTSYTTQENRKYKFLV